MDDLSPIGLAIRELEWIEVGRLDHDTLYPSYSQVLWNVRWNEDAMNLLQVSWQTSCCGLGDGGGVLGSQPCNFFGDRFQNVLHCLAADDSWGAKW